MMADSSAACVVAQQPPCLQEPHEYTKWLDTKTGCYYYVHREDPTKTTWARPSGDNVPLEHHPKPPPQRQSNFERKRLIEKIQLKYREEKREREDAEAEAKRVDYENEWNEAFRCAADTGELNVKRPSKLHPKVYSFEKHFGRELVALRLANALVDKAVPPRVGEILSLTTLSLASNGLTKLPDSLCQLTRLTSLNLLRNRLVELPSRIGDFGPRLTDLRIATNRLEALPPSIGTLTRLDRLVVDCNRLRRLPDSLAELTCHTVSVNANRLVSLPDSLFEMDSLTMLTANDNKIRQIPNSVDRSKSLTRLSLCANEITEVPESLSLMSQLRHLWLDHNKPLSILPWNFFMLEKLEDLQMHGNFGMQFPNQDTLIQGAAVVRDWFRERQEHALFVRKHRIVTSFQDILEQIVEIKPKVCSEAFFEPNVSRHDETWYAIVMEHFWSHALPALRDVWDENRARKGRVTCFPYARHEVEKALATYHDAEGRVQLENVTTMFRRCACVDANGVRKVCVPPASGWMCRRRATLVKAHIVLQRERVERERQRREMFGVEHAIDDARIRAREFIESEQGQAHFYRKAKQRAAREMEDRRRRRREAVTSRKVERAAVKIRETFRQRRTDLAEERQLHETELYRRLRDELEPKEDELDEGYAKEKVRQEIDRVVKTLASMPEDRELEELDEELEATLQQSSEKIAKAEEGNSGIGWLRRWRRKSEVSKEEKELIEELEVELGNRYTNKQVKLAEKEIREEHLKMRKIAASWTGLEVYSLFAAWKRHTRRERRRRAKDRWASKADELQAAADVAAAFELARWNLSKYEKYIDEWSDLPYWKHSDTSAIVWEEPRLEDLLPPRFRLPTPLDQDQVSQVLHEQANTILSPVSTSSASGLETTPRDNEVPSSSSESSSETSSPLDSDSVFSDDDDDDDDETYDGLESEDESEHGLPQIVENESDNEQSVPQSEEDDARMLKWDSNSAQLPQVHQVASTAIVAVDTNQEEVQPDILRERREKELQAALERATIRRKLALSKQQPSKLLAQTLSSDEQNEEMTSESTK